MKTHQAYKSFNTEKSIVELQYNMLGYVVRLKYLKEELEFLNFLVNASIYKANMMDLFENLEHFKKEIQRNLTKCDLLLIEANLKASQIVNKIECDELACDNYFIDAQNSLEQNIYEFNIENNLLKSEIANYLRGVIKTI